MFVTEMFIWNNDYVVYCHVKRTWGKKKRKKKTQNEGGVRIGYV